MTTNITLGPPILEKWLRKHYTIHHINEIEIEIDKTDTMMIIKLKSEEFPDYG